MNDIRLVPLENDDRKQFIKDNQEAFNYGALEEFGCRDDHFEEDGQIISRGTIEMTIDRGDDRHCAECRDSACGQNWRISSKEIR